MMNKNVTQRRMSLYIIHYFNNIKTVDFNLICYIYNHSELNFIKKYTDGY